MFHRLPVPSRSRFPHCRPQFELAASSSQDHMPQVPTGSWVIPLALRERGDIQSSDGPGSLSGQRSGPQSLARRCPGCWETEPWPRGSTRSWQSRLHLRPASVPTSSWARSLAWHGGLALLFWTLFRGNSWSLRTPGRDRCIITRSEKAGAEPLFTSQGFKATAGDVADGLPRPSVCPRSLAGSPDMDGLCVWTLRDHLPRALLILLHPL